MNLRRTKEEMKVLRVLYVCTHNGARSLIAEKFTHQLATGGIEAYSSSFESGKIGPLLIAVMQEIGIELPEEAPKTMWDRYLENETLDWVVSLSDDTSVHEHSIFEEDVDILYGKEMKRLSLSVSPFETLSGTKEGRLDGARKIRDQIKSLVLALLFQMNIATDAG